MDNLQYTNPERSRKITAALKFAAGIFLLPVVYALTMAFIDEIKMVDKASVDMFIAGIITFLAFYLFVYDPGKVYKKGEQIAEQATRFFSPLVKVAPFVIPIYSIILFLVYLAVSTVIKSSGLLHFVLFFLGMSLVFHLVFGARALHSRKKDFLMASYIFSFDFVYIITIAVFVLIFSVLFEPFSGFSFCKQAFSIVSDFFCSLFKQLFL